MSPQIAIEFADRIRLQFDCPELNPDTVEELHGNIENRWQAKAVCRTVVDDAWFPEPTQPVLRSAAVARCCPCPVRRSCLAFALSEGENHGVWGGTTDVQREALRLDLASGVSVGDVLDSATVRPAYLWAEPA